MNFAVFATGYKGVCFLEKLGLKPLFVVSYDNKETKDRHNYYKIIDWCNHNDVEFFKKRDLVKLNKKIKSVEKIFVVGWQYLIKDNLEKLVVFHDSYLPERRGFSPTLSALLEKSQYLGASCFEPEKTLTIEPDYGKIYYREKSSITYPIKLKNAFDKVVDMYVGMAHNLLEHNPESKMINYDNSSFSLWRDKEDLRINWKKSSSEIEQKVFSLGYPYAGATSIYGDKIIHIKEIERLNNINFTNQDDNYGKIWKIECGHPFVICRDGVIKVVDAVDEEGNKVVFNRLRRRFK